MIKEKEILEFQFFRKMNQIVLLNNVEEIKIYETNSQK
jgi:hypothetical protein